jgi:hypothetical protein
LAILEALFNSKMKGYGLIAGFELNSDRLNIVVTDKDDRVITTKTWLYSEVNRPGFPKDKARALRLNALLQVLNFLSRISVDYAVFEDLFLIKSRKFEKSRSGNRKISKFAKKQMLIHGVIKALRLGLTLSWLIQRVLLILRSMRK